MCIQTHTIRPPNIRAVCINYDRALRPLARYFGRMADARATKRPTRNFRKTKLFFIIYVTSSTIQWPLEWHGVYIVIPKPRAGPGIYVRFAFRMLDIYYTSNKSRLKVY